ncbi:MAG TPA: aldo/keto reductase [Vicinamibacterales bacterium]|nr:aldo/keto reductase [Vicinamibacterales bacterium]
MIYRRLGRTDMKVSASSFGAWAIGGFWGKVDDEESMRALHAAVDAGVNFFDTADVYGDGRSERLIARLRRECPGEELWVATKAGRQLPVQSLAGYSRENLTTWVEASLSRLEMDALDLLQLHCPHPDVFDSAEVFGILDDLVVAGKLRYYGVSVETVDEALRAIAHPGVQSVQIIFNLFRQKPADAFFTRARACDVGVIARVPLASGLLTGKLRPDSTFAADDHRNFNRNGELFDKGETFSGVPLDAAFSAVDALRPLVPHDWTMAQFALAWILRHPEVTCAIPGARTVAQAMDNAAAGDLPPIDDGTMSAVREIYEKQIKPIVHGSW